MISLCLYSWVSVRLASARDCLKFTWARSAFYRGLIAVAIFVATPSFARDMSLAEIDGLKIGLSKTVVEGLLAKRNDVVKTRVVPSANTEAATQRPPTIYLNLEGDGFLEIGFARRGQDFVVADITKTLPQANVRQLVEQYGSPDETRRFRKSLVYAWGGRAESQGAITPQKGTRTTLRIEDVDETNVVIRLTAHGAL